MDDISHAVGKPVVIRLLLVAGLSGALIFFALSAHQPSWKGRKLSAWMNELADPNLAENGDPREAIAKIGERGIPYLLNELQAEDSPIKRTVYRFSVSQSWLPDLHYRSADERRLLASLAFGTLGPKAASSCSVLTNLVLIAPSGAFGLLLPGLWQKLDPLPDRARLRCW